MKYPDANINMKRVGPDVTKVDWAFIIGYVLSLIALLFTFDAVSSERERGTLRLMLANSVPRHTILIGKFLGGTDKCQYSFYTRRAGEPLANFHFKCCSPQHRSLGTLGYHFLYCDFVPMSVSGIGSVNIHTRATERSQFSDTPVGLGHLCCFYAQYPRFNRERILTIPIIRAILETPQPNSR